MSTDGVIWTVRYYGQSDGEIKKILAKAIDDILEDLEDRDQDWSAADLADALVTDLDMKPSGAAEIAITDARVKKVVDCLDVDVWEDLTDEGIVAAVLKADQETRKRG